MSNEIWEVSITVVEWSYSGLSVCIFIAGQPYEREGPTD